MGEWQENKYYVLYCSYHGTVRGKKEKQKRKKKKETHFSSLPPRCSCNCSVFRGVFCLGLEVPHEHEGHMKAKAMFYWVWPPCWLKENIFCGDWLHVLCFLGGCFEVSCGRWICAEPAIYLILQQNRFTLQEQNHFSCKSSYVLVHSYVVAGDLAYRFVQPIFQQLQSPVSAVQGLIGKCMQSHHLMGCFHVPCRCWSSCSLHNQISRGC